MSPHSALLLASLLTVAAVLVPRLRRWPLWIMVLATTLSFAALTALVQIVLGSPLAPRFGAVASGTRFWEQLIEAGWWLALARLLVGLSRLFVVLENRPRETRIVSDLLAGAIAVATLLAIVNFAFEVPIRGLLATSGVIAIVLGLALQSTLSDVFSGIAVGLERPYNPGDLLWVEGGIEGTVAEINWRSTRILTGDGNIAVVPNSIIAKARLVNRSTPTHMRTATVEVALDADCAIDHAHRTLMEAIRSCRHLLPVPAPVLTCIEVKGDGVVWEIAFSVATSAGLGPARTELLSHVHRHLHHAGIPLGVGGQAARGPVPAPTLGALLAQSDLFGVVPDAERARLIDYFRAERRGAGETLIRQGDVPEAMFLLASGTAEVTVGSRIVHRTSPGECLGAIGLITGEPYAATATALTELRAWRIGRTELAAAVKAEPTMATALEELACRGQEALRRDAVALDHDEPVKPEMFLTRLRGLLRSLGS